MPSTRTAPYRTFLSRLKTARKDAGLGQVDVAKLLEKPQSYVSKCESGERRVDVVELAEFARIYGKPLTFFVPATSAKRLARSRKHPRTRS